ncbi:TnsD family transposase [Dehalobacter sp. DCM]|uniref:TnsD family Tn7-like transposition protein n=1 Tax=Dehalobacter sp. DCM TaxID=2907827 RepID=UPI0030814BAD|nr:TnsD family transposase [Dehalobacter sp. DCM]
MLSYFPDPYENELLYSTIARYHYYSGNLSNAHTLKDLFNISTVKPSIFIPIGIKTLADKIRNKKYTVDYLLQNHTIYPLFSPFLNQKTRNHIINGVDSGKGRLNSLRIMRNYDNLKYCPLCAKEDYNKHTEAYFRREHQIPNLNICCHHNCKLKTYPISRLNVSPDSFIRFNYSLVEKEINDNRAYTDPINEKLDKVLVNSAYHLLTSNFQNAENSLRQRYLYFLRSKNYMFSRNKINELKLMTDFKNFYTEESLSYWNLNFDEKHKYNWIRRFLQRPDGSQDPIKNILLIYFLCGDLYYFFSININDELNFPFGEGPWPCLNPIAEHYGQNVITNFELVKNRSIMGYFKCSCGFTYKINIFDKSRFTNLTGSNIVEFGYEWEEKLKGLILKGYGITRLAMEMKCSDKTILRCSEKIGLRDRINSDKKYSHYIFNKNINQDQKMVNYKKRILNYIEKYPQATRSQIRRNLHSTISWLRLNDPNWLEDHLPSNKSPNFTYNNEQYWHEKDDKLYSKVLETYNLIKNQPMRLTKGRIFSKSGIKVNNFIKLPKTKAIFDSIVETIPQFVTRLVDFQCRKCFEEYGEINITKVRAGCNYYMRTNLQKLINERMDYNIRILVRSTNSG